MKTEIIVGDCLDVLRTLPAESVQCCVTSPPYWGLRDYGVAGQIGQEATPELFTAKLVEVFREVQRVLRADGTLWMNLGDSYAASGMGGNPSGSPHTKQGTNHGSCIGAHVNSKKSAPPGLKPKDLVGIPWRVAFALQADGWYLRSDIIWHKPNPMPESVTDRPTKSHEYIFLMTKSERYFYDAEAILEPVSKSTHQRISQNLQAQVGSDRANGGMKTNGNMKAVFRKGKTGAEAFGVRNNPSFAAGTCMPVTERNKRTVWTVPAKGYDEAHFATYPPDLIKPCILAGSRPGDTILDPFGGSGTTGMVATELGRNSILIELNPEYAELSRRRVNVTPGLAL